MPWYVAPNYLDVIDTAAAPVGRCLGEKTNTVIGARHVEWERYPPRFFCSAAREARLIRP